MVDTSSCHDTLNVGSERYDFFNIGRVNAPERVQQLPYSLKILLENLLRNEDGINVTADDIEALCGWDATAEPSTEIAFTPARVILQDFTGVPVVVDLAAMRDAMGALGGDPDRINPLSPVELVIDHSVQVDNFGTHSAVDLNTAIEFQRNRERYSFLRWGQQALRNFKVVPPNTGIVHQVNLEYLARVVCSRPGESGTCLIPDTLVGTDSHTTMVNGLGVLGWGVGGIEAEAVMLGQPITMLIPQVVGFELTGQLPEGATATDLVLMIVQILREKGVVGKFVEFFGPGLRHLPLADRATIANMAPEYGATCGIFPIDEETLRYLTLSGRSREQIALVEAYARAQGMFHDDESPEVVYSERLTLDMTQVEPSLAGPKRPQDRIGLKRSKAVIGQALAGMQQERGAEAKARGVEMTLDGETFQLSDGAVVIAAITSCTNTSNPEVMLGAGLLAKKAVERGLQVKPWVKTSLAPGSRVVTAYLQKAGVLGYLEQLRFDVVGYGCTTCIGNSGPLPEAVHQGIVQEDLVVCSAVSGNRNFEGRIHADVKMNFLASPALVVAYAIAGTMDIDLYNEPLGTDGDGVPVYLKDIWPTTGEVRAAIAEAIDPEMFRGTYQDVFAGDERWNSIAVPQSERYEWDPESTYIKQPPFFEGMGREVPAIADIQGARVLALLGDSITTDHISPAGAIKIDSPAGKYLIEKGEDPSEFNSYGSRRGNHEVMMRGTFANVRLRNRLAPGTEGGWTTHQPSGEQMTIFDASSRYRQEGVPLLVVAGTEYGSGSSRDWAAKGTLLLGVRAVLVKSYERIHRSNLIGMGVLPLQFQEGDDVASLGLDGTERYDIEGVAVGVDQVTVVAHREDGPVVRFPVQVRIDTPKEWEYYQNGGILHYVLRQLAAGSS